MSYTIGIKKWWGFEKYDVTRHSWENFRFIFDLADGSQLIVPGFKASGVKVFKNFWDHVGAQNRAQAAVELAKIQEAVAHKERLELEEFKRVKALEAKLEPVQTVPKYNPPAHHKLQGASIQQLSFSPDAEEQYGHVNPEVMQHALQRVRGILPGEPVDA